MGGSIIFGSAEIGNFRHLSEWASHICRDRGITERRFPSAAAQTRI